MSGQVVEHVIGHDHVERTVGEREFHDVGRVGLDELDPLEPRTARVAERSMPGERSVSVSPMRGSTGAALTHRAPVPQPTSSTRAPLGQLTSSTSQRCQGLGDRGTRCAAPCVP